MGFYEHFGVGRDAQSVFRLHGEHEFDDLDEAQTLKDFLNQVRMLEKRIHDLRYLSMIDILIGRRVDLDDVLSFVKETRQRIFQKARYWQSLHMDDRNIQMVIHEQSKPSEEEIEMAEIVKRKHILSPVMSLPNFYVPVGTSIAKLGEEAKRLLVTRLRLCQLEEGINVDNVGEKNTLSGYLYPGGSRESRLKEEHLFSDLDFGLYRQAIELESLLPEVGRRYARDSERNLNPVFVRTRDMYIAKKKIAFEEAHFRYKVGKLTAQQSQAA